MKSFRFRLEPLLRVRRFELRRQAALLASARVEHGEACRREDCVTAERDRVARAASRLLAAGVTAGPLRDLALTGEGWRARGVTVAAERAALSRALEEARAEVRAAHGRVEALERLRERRRERWRREAERVMQRDLDELAQRIERGSETLR